MAVAMHGIKTTPQPESKKQHLDACTVREGHLLEGKNYECKRVEHN